MSIYDVINPVMNRLLRSPWHQLFSRRMMTVTIMGAYIKAVPQDKKFHGIKGGADDERAVPGSRKRLVVLSSSSSH